MFVLVVAGGIPSPKDMLNGIFEFEQAKALRSKGCKVILAVIDLRSVRHWRKWGIEHYRKDGIEVYAVNIPCGRVGSRALNKAGIAAFNKLYAGIQKRHGSPDVIHAHFTLYPGFVTMRAIQKSNIPLVITEHSSQVINKNLSPYEVYCLKETVNKASSFICVGEGLKKSVIELTGTSRVIQVIPNMVSGLFKYKKKLRYKDEFTFLGIGNLNKRKRFSLSIDAFAKAFKGKDHVKLRIVGGGSLYNELQKQIDGLDMNNQISLLGEMEREEVACQMQECDAFVLASAFETFGVVYIEAMACGKPVIATKNGGAEWIVNERNGILINTDNEIELTEAMKKMISFYGQFSSAEIAQTTVTKYSEEAVAQQLIKVYESVI